MLSSEDDSSWFCQPPARLLTPASGWGRGKRKRGPLKSATSGYVKHMLVTWRKTCQVTSKTPLGIQSLCLFAEPRTACLFSSPCCVPGASPMRYLLEKLFLWGVGSFCSLGNMVQLIKSIVQGGGRFQRLFPPGVSATASDRCHVPLDLSAPLG